jgi:hypothetical protein
MTTPLEMTETKAAYSLLWNEFLSVYVRKYIGQSGISSFYCSLKYQLERQQISAMNKLWCISPCIQQSGQEHFMCK